MKSILTILLLFSSSFLYAQNLKVEVSKNAPFELEKVVNQYTGHKDVFLVKNGTQKVESDSYGHWLRIYKNGEKVLVYYLEYDHEKTGVVIENYTGNHDGDKYMSFKTKTDGKRMHLKVGFSVDGKYVVALAIKNNQLLAYKGNLSTKEMVIKNLAINIDRLPTEIHRLSASKDAKMLYATGPGNPLFVVDMDTQKATSLPFSDYGQLRKENWRDIFPSLISDHVLLTTKEDIVDNFPNMYFFDTKKKQIVYSHNRFDRQNTKVVFISVTGILKEDFSSLIVTEPGIGVVVTKQSLLAFDHELNYFTVCDGCKTNEKSDVFEYVSFNGGKDSLEPQPDLIPIISDVLTDHNTAILFEKVGELCERDFNRKLAFQVFESAEPFSDELVQALSQSDKKYVVEYVGKYVAQWINNTPKMELAEAGKSTNVNRKKFMDNYASYSKSLSQEEYGSYLADATEIQNASEKLQPLTVDLYYMSVDELFEKGNAAVQLGAKMSPKAALLGIKFYEVAAEKEPTEPIYQVSMGSAYMYAGQYANAIESYNKALAIRSDYPLALFGIMKASFVPITKGETTFNDNVAKSIQSNANRFLAVAPADYLSEKKYAKQAKAFAKLYLDDKDLYAQYNQATGQSNVLMRTGAVELLMPKIAATGNTYLVADMANVSGFDYIKIGESNNNEVGYYKQADKLLRKSVKGGVYDPETYYEWARINITFLKNKPEGKRIVAEAQKKYPTDKNFGVLVANDYYNAGRELFLNKSYVKAIPNFEKYLANANKIVPKAYDYLGVSYYNTKSYAKAAKNFELLKSKDNPNTLQAFYPNFEAVLAYSKKPNGAAPKLIDNADKIDEIEEQYVQGTRLLKKGQRSEGLRLMEASTTYYDQINYNYGQSIAHSGLAGAYQEAGEKSKAESHYQSCISNGAQSSKCYNNLAILYIKNDQISDAKSLVNEGLRKFPNDTDLTKVKQYLYQ